MKYKIGDRVRIKSTGSSVETITPYSYSNIGKIFIIKSIVFIGGSASESDPRYCGIGWNNRACDLELVKMKH